ncbi:6056_t:CDS:2 [Paraglomus brasilianum]|uniref:6056_t:CDS:1 n=1 Tax=Paraglomus brasilianum TaxID=144538 RepID=A0A9N9B139_9GLOM|nr:6056_t:CDS:2 [Paraglomus brasilianum]
MSTGSIDGLRVIENFITPEEESELISEIDNREWGGNGIPPNPEMKRRTQHYGYEFSYRHRNARYIGLLPSMFSFLLSRLVSEGIVPSPPDMCTVNEYNLKQGIMPHRDASLFGPTILSLSLLSPCLMRFEKEGEDEIKVLLPIRNELSFFEFLPLAQRSLLVMTNSSRFDYKHSISKDEIEYLGDQKIVRGRRVSLTFRSLIKEESKME